MNLEADFPGSKYCYNKPSDPENGVCNVNNGRSTI